MAVSHRDINRVLDFIIPCIKAYQDNVRQSSQCEPCPSFHRPFVLGLTGLQGSGKSTWTTALAQALNDIYEFRTISLSIDDLYQDHAGLIRLQQDNPDNKLLRTRGQPGTHDEMLACQLFKSLRSGNDEGISIPEFDKARYHGEGDRVPEEEWEWLAPGTAIEVVIFEGWCLGFQPLPDSVIKSKWEMNRFAALGLQPNEQQLTGHFPTRTLQDHSLEHLLSLNQKVSRYCDLFTGPQHLDYLVHLDTDELSNVYNWRLQQEHALRQRKGTGMSDNEVSKFVQGYMPAYELYLDQLRQGFFGSTLPDDQVCDRCEVWKEQLGVLLDRDRAVTKIEIVKKAQTTYPS